MGGSSLPAFPADRVWGVEAVRYIMRITGHHREAAEASLRVEVDCGRVRLYSRMTGPPEPLRRKHGANRRGRAPARFEHYFVDRADLEKRWPDDRPLIAEVPSDSASPPHASTNADNSINELGTSQPTSDSSPPHVATEAVEIDDEIARRARGILDVVGRLGDPPRPNLRWKTFGVEVIRACGHDPDNPPRGYDLRTIQNQTRKILKDRKR